MALATERARRFLLRGLVYRLFRSCIPPGCHTQFNSDTVFDPGQCSLDLRPQKVSLKDILRYSRQRHDEIKMLQRAIRTARTKGEIKRTEEARR